MASRSVAERLKAEGWAVVEEWLHDHEPESVFLDFKRSERGEGLDAKDKETKGSDVRNLAKSLSAFANTEGGLLVFGVECDQDPAGRDHAKSIQRNGHLAELARDLRSRMLTATSPPVPGADVIGPIFDPNDNAFGVVVVVVPQSDGGPHRALLDDKVKDRYFQRTETSCTVATHSILEGWFGRRPPPKLRLSLVRNKDNSMTVALLNEGRGPARSPRVHFAMPAEHRSSFGDGRYDRENWTIRTNRHGWNLQGNRDVIVFPDDEIFVGTFVIVPSDELNARLDAEGARPVRIEGTIPTRFVDPTLYPPQEPPDEVEKA
jgi:hypothetical protein